MSAPTLSTIAAFSSDGRVFRAFDHVIAADAGSLLCVPLPLVAGDLRPLVDGCPVPWQEALMVIDAPFSGTALPPAAIDRQVRDRLFSFFGRTGWSYDLIRFGTGTHPIPRLRHPSGIFFSRITL